MSTERDGFTQAALRTAGFAGFIAAAELRAVRMTAVPTGPGVYVVTRPDLSPPTFAATSCGGWFKGRDPTVPVQVLRAKWVAGAELVYVGKATSGRSGNSGLRTRLDLLLRYGAGQPVGHQGGRYLWQVTNIDDYRYGWRESTDPTEVENQLLASFFAAYGSYPFANIAGPRR